MNKELIIKKWSIVVDTHNIKNKYLHDLFCLYMEYNILFDLSHEQMIKLQQDVNVRIKQLSTIKEVVPYINEITGKVEYHAEGKELKIYSPYRKVHCSINELTGEMFYKIEQPSDFVNIELSEDMIKNIFSDDFYNHLIENKYI